MGNVSPFQPRSLLRPFQGKWHRNEHPEDHETPCCRDGRVPDHSPVITAPLCTAQEGKAVKTSVKVFCQKLCQRAEHCAIIQLIMPHTLHGMA